MKVKELITALLDCNMNAEVSLFLDEPYDDPEVGEMTGFIFCIKEIESSRNNVEFVFKDWRKETI